MKQTKRPALLVGLIITTFEVLIYLISYLSSNSKGTLETVIFIIFIILLIININSFYTVNLTAKEFKKKRYLPWISFSMVTLYNCYSFAIVIISCRDGISPIDTVLIANLFILILGSLLYIPGILKRIIDDKITYEEHLKQIKNEE